MAIELDFDPVTSESIEKELPIPVNNSDPGKGVVLVTLRYIPRGRYSAFTSVYQAAVNALAAMLKLTVEQAGLLISTKSTLAELMAVATAEVANIEKLGQAWELLFIARGALVRWGVASHNPNSFKTAKVKGEPSTPTPFDPVTELWEGVSYQLASTKMIALYSHPRVGLLWNLCSAVMSYNEDRFKMPEEIWEKNKEEASPLGNSPVEKAGEAKAAPPKKKART